MKFALLFCRHDPKKTLFFNPKAIRYIVCSAIHEIV